MTHQPPASIVFTNKARCRDCHRCLRVCPVKAIRMQNGQAHVVPERCISCGTCIRECPQGAKTYRRDLERAKRVMHEKRLTAVSVAPSFAGILQTWERRRLASALRRLGFRHVAETSIGAALIARETARLAESRDSPIIGTACPVVVNWFEARAPEALSALAPVVSPMVAHARYLRQKLGPDIGLVFVGPCVGKKAEADRPEHQGLIDAVLTFEELDEWLKQEGVTLNGCEESDFDEVAPVDAVLFPLAGGQARAGRLDTDLLSERTITTTGVDELHDILPLLHTQSASGRSRLIEPLFCRQGCINGPACGRPGSVLERRRGLIEYVAELRERPSWIAPETQPNLCTSYAANVSARLRDASEEEVRAVLEKTGKGKPEDQLNCGACGYGSCRDKAIAVIQGMAEPEMCIPHMRRLAEQRTDRIIETSPNGIVICGERLEILHMNQAFRRMFLCSEAVLGKHISYL
ncbi:MAG TPA: [Fe-Fe] hydrogenase large subunit C-terminal domain-containing protein, partial [Candidatus Ozemobacteraceae bacterium]|nr:[Fe-Fe] hydrogenase large subunit C-terminal domain-containing protein [Candidatus Ozemobacteraceae bacterium]